MKRKILFAIKQGLKMILQNGILPLVYGFWRLVYGRREPDLIIFADAHHSRMPFSMQRIHDELLRRGYDVVDVIHNFAEISYLRSVAISVGFMKLYARAKYVFICDTFLPVVSCSKRPETTVIQLLHSCGLLKKMGYDTTEDIPAGYVGAVYKNYDLVTVSAPCCVEPLTNAMRLEPGTVKPLGISRTDYYFDPAWHERCRANFRAQHPDWVGKKIVLWAPTFRGNAGDPRQVGMEAIQALEQQLGAEYVVIKKVHPHVDGRYHLSNCAIATEELFPVTDLLISDYSSVTNEFMAFGKPYVMFAPDLSEYEAVRGFYVPYESLSPYVVTEQEKLADAVKQAIADTDPKWVQAQRDFHLAACDGNATVRILEYLGL